MRSSKLDKEAPGPPYNRGPVERRDERQGKGVQGGQITTKQAANSMPGFGGDVGSEERSGEAEQFDCM